MRTTAILIACMIVSANAEPTLEELVQKRDAVLNQLLEYEKIGLKQGRATDVDVHEATVRLYSYRRDMAKSLEDRIKWQEFVVATERDSVKRMTSRIAVGVSTPKDALIAEEHALAAEQRLAELRLEK